MQDECVTELDICCIWWLPQHKTHLLQQHICCLCSIGAGAWAFSAWLMPLWIKSKRELIPAALLRRPRASLIHVYNHSIQLLWDFTFKVMVPFGCHKSCLTLPTVSPITTKFKDIKQYKMKKFIQSETRTDSSDLWLIIDGVGSIVEDCGFIYSLNATSHFHTILRLLNIVDDVASTCWCVKHTSAVTNI